jgi:RNase P/RNase MRP subunit p30
MINSTNLNEVKSLIKKERKPIIIKAQSNDFNRKLLDQCKFNVLLGPETSEKKDSLRQIDSGLNEVMISIAKKKGIVIGIDFEDLKRLDKKEKVKRLVRIKQNIQICKKADVKLIAINAKNDREAFSLLLSLGASTKQAREAIEFK